MSKLNAEKVMTVIAISIVALFTGIVASSLFFARGQVLPAPQPTGYFVEVQNLVVPQDITQTPVGTFVVYAKDGTTAIWQENVHLAKYTTDAELETVLDAWANPYIDRYERQQALDNLAKTSKIIGKKLEHKK